jgi:hypothetical protein
VDFSIDGSFNLARVLHAYGGRIVAKEARISRHSNPGQLLFVRLKITPNGLINYLESLDSIKPKAVPNAFVVQASDPIRTRPFARPSAAGHTDFDNNRCVRIGSRQFSLRNDLEGSGHGDGARLNGSRNRATAT